MAFLRMELNPAQIAAADARCKWCAVGSCAQHVRRIVAYDSVAVDVIIALLVRTISQDVAASDWFRHCPTDMRDLQSGITTGVEPTRFGVDPSQAAKRTLFTAAAHQLHAETD